MTTGFWYLATPYSRYPYGTDAAHRVACEIAARLFRAGVMVFAPIAHSHAIAVAGDLGLGFDTWEAFDVAMLSAARGVIVAKMEGWYASEGIQREIEWCRENGRSVVYMEEDGMPDLSDVE